MDNLEVRRLPNEGKEYLHPFEREAWRNYQVSVELTEEGEAFVRFLKRHLFRED